MSKIKDNGLDLYGAESFEQQQFGAAGVEARYKYSSFPFFFPLCVISQSSLRQLLEPTTSNSLELDR